MEDQHEQQILNQMEQTRSALTEKLEALEAKVTDKVVTPVTDAVEKAADVASSIVETVKETVENVSGRVEQTVQNVTGKVEQSTQALASAFDVSKHVQQHPWLVFGIAATTGCVVGSFLGGRSSRHSSSSSQESGGWSRPKHARGSNGASHHAEASPLRSAPKQADSEHSGWIKDQMRQLGTLAISALMSTIRDLAKRSVPGPLGDRIGEHVESMANSLGAQPIHGDVVGPIAEQVGSGADSSHSRREGPETVNRLRTGGSGTDML